MNYMLRILLGEGRSTVHSREEYKTSKKSLLTSRHQLTERIICVVVRISRVLVPIS